MTGGAFGSDGSISDLPWASVFDPAVNVRALGEIQARGFRAASELVDRFVRTADADRAATDPSAEELDSEQVDREIPSAATLPDADRLLRSWQRLIGEVAGSLRGAVSPSQSGTATFDLVNDTSSGQVVLEAREPGAVSTEVWLHNGGTVDLGKVRLRCSDLLAHDGTIIASRSVRFEPDTVAMVARSSRGVTMQVDVADDLPPGHYRGTLLADGHDEVWLPVVLTVTSHVP